MTDLATVPGAVQEHLTRELPDGGLIEFTLSPAGWLTTAGDVRSKPYRAYHYTPAPDDCSLCLGTGRIPGKREGTTKNCPPCKATGNVSRRTRFPSVTTLLDSISPKPGLPPWAEARGIEGGVTAVRRGLVDAFTPLPEAIEIVRSARLGSDAARDDAATRGLNVHDLLREYMTTGSPPKLADHPIAHHGYIQGLARWLRATQPEPIAVEQLVVHPEDGYAGRLDLRCYIDGQLVTVDAKTQEKCGIYSSAHVQVNLYERAAIRCEDDPADRLMVVAFAANGAFREMPADHGPSLVDAALAFYRQIRPVDSACESANAIEREARKVAA